MSNFFLTVLLSLIIKDDAFELLSVKIRRFVTLFLIFNLFRNVLYFLVKTGKILTKKRRRFGLRRKAACAAKLLR